MALEKGSNGTEYGTIDTRRRYEWCRNNTQI